jgi:hypothetical protein
MSASHLGKKRSAEFCRKLGDRTKGKQYGLGSIRTPEQRKQLSLSAPKGEHNHFWRGGVATEHNKERHRVEARLWREAVYSRDKWECQKCGVGGGFNAHHIKNFHKYPELRFAIDNGITLCVSCHAQFHRLYGRHDNNESQIAMFLSELSLVVGA